MPISIGLATLLGSGIAAGGGLFSAWRQRRADRAAFSNQIDLENTAIQRRVADLRAAGQSPTLATGSPAGTPPPIVPKFNIGPAIDAANAVAQIDGARAAADKARADANFTNKNADWVDPIRRAELEQKELNIKFAKDYNPHRIQQIIKSNAGIDLDNANKKLDKHLKLLNIGRAGIQLQLDRFALMLKKRFGVRKELAEVTTKEIAADLAAYTLEKWQNANLIPGGPSSVGGLVWQANANISQKMEKLLQWYLSQFKGGENNPNRPRKITGQYPKH